MAAWFYMLRLKSGQLCPGATEDLRASRLIAEVALTPAAPACAVVARIG